MKLHTLKGGNYEEVHAEGHNSWRNYLLGSNKAGRKILGAALTLALTLSFQAAPAQAGSRTSPFADATLVQGRMGGKSPQNLGFLAAPATKAITPRQRRSLMARPSPLSPFDHLVYFTWPSPVIPPPSSPLLRRSQPDKSLARTLTQARHYVGTPYRRGGSLQAGRSTDCSGFVQFIYKKAHIDLPRSSSQQAREGALVAQSLDFDKLRPGDLLFFSRSRRHIGHVGIYVGEGKMIHASTWGRGVIISDLLQAAYQHTFVVAKRFF